MTDGNRMPAATIAATVPEVMVRIVMPANVMASKALLARVLVTPPKTLTAAIADHNARRGADCHIACHKAVINDH